MTLVAFALVLTPGVLFAYAYAVYPALLWLVSRRQNSFNSSHEAALPVVTLTVPVYNEAHTICAKLDDLLRLDYPADKLQILVLSDASTDATDRLVAAYAGRGVELTRLPSRRGKTAAENAAAPLARGSIIVNSDAAVRLPPGALRTLVRAFDDPRVGVASGRDVSIGAAVAHENRGESGYVGYEMWVRRLETRVGSIVGASGCFYGIRASIYDAHFPEHLSRDFASALMARANGFRAVSVDDAVCYVPRAASLQSEFRRKIRTMSRGLETLWYWRRMLNPVRYGLFALMLFSHKLCRWLVYLTVPAAVVGLLVLAPRFTPAAAALVALALAVATGLAVLRRGRSGVAATPPAAMLGFGVASMLAGIMAWITVLRRQHSPLWEPTRRPT